MMIRRAQPTARNSAEGHRGWTASGWSVTPRFVKVLVKRASVLCAAAALAGCYGPGGEVTGEVRVTDSPLGSWNQVLDACYSGQPQSFFGVDIGRSSDERTFVRLVADPIDGIVVLLREPAGDEALVVTATTCDGLTATIQPTNTYYNDVRLLEGRLRADCELADHTKIHASVDFAGCH